MSANLIKSPLAIVGMACRLPGADDLHEYWELVRGGCDAVVELPAERLDRTLYFDPAKDVRGKTYSTLGGLIKDRRVEDDFARLAPGELYQYDPCHQILCETVAQACRHAGYDPNDFPDRNTGVYVGHSGGSSLGGELAFASLAEETADYLRDTDAFAELPPEVQERLIAAVVDRVRTGRPSRDQRGGPDLAANTAAGLVARVLGVDGPQMTIDAACASSLAAMALGAMALAAGRIEMAIIGGASYSKADSLILFSQAQSCTASGSRPFDARADGLVSSEGYVAMAVKTLDRAQSDGDTIHGVVRGMGFSSDGMGRSLWAPRKEGQIEAMQRAYDSQLDPRQVQYIEAHATSTQVGDATELHALRDFFGPLQLPRKIPVGSVKSNIGHTLETAGMASLLKVVLAMKQGIVPPTIHVEQPNPEIPWDDMPFYLASSPQRWVSNDRPRRAAVNAFGIGGINVHLVVEEGDAAERHVPAERDSEQREELLTLTLSPAKPGERGQEGQQAFAAAMPEESGQDTSRPVTDAKPGERGQKHEAIAVVGRGVVLPGAHSIKQFAELIRDAGEALSSAPEHRWRRGIGVSRSQPSRWQTPTCRGGFVRDYQFDWRRHRIPPKQIAQANPLQFMLLDATYQALQEAGYDEAALNQTRAAVVVGTIFGGEFSHQLHVGLRLPELRRILESELEHQQIPAAQIRSLADQYEQLLLQAKPALLDRTGSFTSSTLATRIAKTLNVMGGALAVDAGESSSLAAVEAASDLLRTGACSLVLCGAAQHAMDLAAFEELALRGYFSTREASGDQEGQLPGEGVVVTALKRLSDARRDGDRVLAVLRGHGVAAGDRAIETAAQRALQAADCPAAKVQRIFGDCRRFSSTETDAGSLETIYGRRAETPALVRQIGDTQATQGLATLVWATLAEPGGETPATQDGSTAGGGWAALTTHGTNGLVHHLVFETVPESLHRDAELRAPSPAATASDPPARREGDGFKETAMPSPSADPRGARIVRLGATSPGTLTEQLEQAAAHADRYFAAAQPAFSPVHTCRAAIVAESPGSLAEQSARAAQRWRQPESQAALHDRGIFCWERTAEAPRVAFLFPGQGSQYPGMLRGLVEYSKAAKAKLAEADAILRRLGSKTFTEVAWSDRPELGTDLWATQMAVLVADVLWEAALREQGIHPDVVSGHSFGEIPALVTAGSWTLDQALRMTRSRTEAVLASDVGPSGMLAVSAPAEKVAAMIEEHRAPVYLTHRNAPRQTVVGGQRDAVEQFAQVVKAENLAAQILRVPCAFHTPLLYGAQDTWRRILAHERLLPPTIPLLSNVFNRYVAEPDEIRANLVAQLSEPVRYAQLVDRLANDDVLLLIEVGPKRTLTQFNRRILAEQAAICVPTDSPTKSVAVQLMCIRAAAECMGREDRTGRSEAPQPIRAVRSPAPGTPKEVEHFDAMAKRRQRRRAEADPRTGGTPHAAVAKEEKLSTLSVGKAAESGQEMPGAGEEQGLGAEQNRTASEPSSDQRLEAAQRFLIDFIVEETGFPPDVVDLDADLEANLGIDSIKKAQLVGELCNRFDIVTDQQDSMILGQYRTLGDVLALLVDSPAVARDAGDVARDAGDAEETCGQGQGAPQSGAEEEEPLTRTVSHAKPGERGEDAPLYRHNGVSAENGDTAGEPYRRGWEHGRQHRDAIRGALLDWADRPCEAEELAGAASEPPCDHWPAATKVKWQGVADGAAVHIDNLLAFQCSEETARRDADRLWLVNGESIAEPPSDSPSEPASPDATPSEHEPKEILPQARGDALRTTASRYVLRVLPTTTRSGAPTEPVFSGAAVILGDNPVADAIQQQLEQRRVTVHRLAVSGDPAADRDLLQQAWDRQQAPHLFLTTPHDPDAATVLDHRAWQRRRGRGVIGPFWVCQRWLQLVREADLMDQATLVGVTALGGDFGFSCNALAAESGALTGLLKAILIENWARGFRATPIKLIDASAGAPPDETARAVWRELAVPSYDVEVARRDGRRHAVRAIREPVVGAHRHPISPGGVWVCTGGARGITAYTARELGRRYGVRLHLLGTSASPQIPEDWRDLDPERTRRLQEQVMRQARALGQSPIQAWRSAEKALEIDRTLRTLAADGVSATYHQCDVADAEQLQGVLDRIRRSDGPIEGVLHGAGVGQDARFEQKRPEKVQQCVGAKVDGALALMELTREDPLKYFVAFGSISGRFGANGHTDYSLANDMLAKLVGWYRRQRPEVAATAFHWHAWGDVGMAARPDTRLALEMIDMDFMPASEGVQHLIDELEIGAPEPEVLITDEKYHRAFFPEETLMREAARQTHSRPRSPLLEDAKVQQQDDWQVTEIQLDPTAEPFLREHRLDDRPLLPLVVGLELLCEAAAQLADVANIGELSQVRAFHALRFPDDSPQTVRVRARRAGGHSVTCELTADIRTRDGRLVEADRVYLKARVAIENIEGCGPLFPELAGDTGGESGHASTPLPNPFEGDWQPVRYEPRGSRFYLGPELQCLRRIHVDGDAAWGRVAAPALVQLAGAQRSVEGWIIPSAALDACLYATGILAWTSIEPGPALPVEIGRLQLGRLPHPGEACLVHSQIRRREEGRAWFDFTLTGDDGDLILTATGYAVAWLVS